MPSDRGRHRDGRGIQLHESQAGASVGFGGRTQWTERGSRACEAHARARGPGAFTSSLRKSPGSSGPSSRGLTQPPAELARQSQFIAVACSRHISCGEARCASALSNVEAASRITGSRWVTICTGPRSADGSEAKPFVRSFPGPRRYAACMERGRESVSVMDCRWCQPDISMRPCNG